jgi:hypothetical protein
MNDMKAHYISMTYGSMNDMDDIMNDIKMDDMKALMFSMTYAVDNDMNDI